MSRASSLLHAALVAALCVSGCLSDDTGSGECVEYPCRPKWEKSTEGVFCPAGLTDLLTDTGALTHHAGLTDGSPGYKNSWISKTVSDPAWVAGTHTEAYSGPTGIAFKRHGLVAFIADTANNVIRSTKTRGQYSKTAAGLEPTDGSTAAAPGFVDGAGSVAKFRGPMGVAFHPSEKFALVADTDNHVIRYIDTTIDSDTIVSTVAGTYTGAEFPDCNEGNQCTGTAGQDEGDALGTATFQSPTALAFHPSGDYALILDGSASSWMIRKFMLWGQVTNIYTSTSPLNGIAFIWGGDAALFTGGVSLGIHRIDMYDDTVTDDWVNVGTLAAFTSPSAIAVADTGTFGLVVDGSVIRGIQFENNYNFLVEVAGASQTSGNSADGTAPNAAQFSGPLGIALAPGMGGGDGLLALISDTGNNLIRKLDLCPTRANAQCGPGYYSHRAGVTDGPHTYTWPDSNDGSTTYTTQKYPICKKCSAECPVYWSYETTNCTTSSDRVCTGLNYKVRMTVEMESDPTVIDEPEEKSSFGRAIGASVAGVFVRSTDDHYLIPEVEVRDVIEIPPRHLGRSQFSPWKILIEFDVYTTSFANADSVRTDLATVDNINTNLATEGFAASVTKYTDAQLRTNYHQCRAADHRFGRTLDESAGAPVRNTLTCGSCLFANDWDTRAYHKRAVSEIQNTAAATQITGNPSLDDGYYHVRQLSTFALNNSAPGGCSADCTDILDLSYPNMDFLDIPKGIFDNLPNIEWLSLAGNGIGGVPEGAFDGLSPTATIDLRCTNITCAPKVLPGQTLLLPDHVQYMDTCQKINSTKYGPWCTGCDFFINGDGMLSKGGVCRTTCQELDLRNCGVKHLPFWPNGAFDSISGLKVSFTALPLNRLIALSLYRFVASSLFRFIALSLCRFVALPLYAFRMSFQCMMLW